MKVMHIKVDLDTCWANRDKFIDIAEKTNAKIYIPYTGCFDSEIQRKREAFPESILIEPEEIKEEDNNTFVVFDHKLLTYKETSNVIVIKEGEELTQDSMARAIRILNGDRDRDNKIDILDYKQKLYKICERYGDGFVPELCNICPLVEFECGRILDTEFKNEWLETVVDIVNKKSSLGLKSKICPTCKFDYSNSASVDDLNYCPRCGEKVGKVPMKYFPIDILSKK